MKDTIYAVIAATVAMLITSGVVALATAASPEKNGDVAAEEFVAQMLDAHYAEAVADARAPLP